MKNFKKIIVAIAALVILSTVFTSCKKVSNGKLDGEWELTSGSETETYTETGPENSSRKYTTTYDGKTRTVVSITDGVTQPAGPTTPYTMNLIFDKKAGTYQMKSTSSYKDDYEVSAVNSTTGEEKEFIVKDNVTYNSVEDGIFSITGGSGDIKKNSQIFLRSGGYKSDWTRTYTYYDGNTIINPSGWKNRWNNETLPATKTGTDQSKGVSNSGYVLNVDELKGGEMKISAEIIQEETEGAYTEKEEIKINWNFKKK
jgi:hypothetical protein